MGTFLGCTPLEALVISQCLARYGTDSGSMTHVLERLRGSVIFKRQDNIDDNRLQPDALRALYSALLEDAQRLDGTANGISGQDGRNGNLSSQEQNPKKRKRSTSPVAAVENGWHDRRLLAQIVDHLYIKYKDDMIERIREDERKFENAQREIEQLERGALDRHTPQSSLESNSALGSSTRHQRGTEQEAQDGNLTTAALPNTQRHEPPAASQSNSTDGLREHAANRTTDSVVQNSQGAHHSLPTLPTPQIAAAQPPSQHLPHFRPSMDRGRRTGSPSVMPSTTTIDSVLHTAGQESSSVPRLPSISELPTTQSPAPAYDAHRLPSPSRILPLDASVSSTIPQGVPSRELPVPHQSSRNLYESRLLPAPNNEPISSAQHPQLPPIAATQLPPLPAAATRPRFHSNPALLPQGLSQQDVPLPSHIPGAPQAPVNGLRQPFSMPIGLSGPVQDPSSRPLHQSQNLTSSMQSAYTRPFPLHSAAQQSFNASPVPSRILPPLPVPHPSSGAPGHGLSYSTSPVAGHTQQQSSKPSNIIATNRASPVPSSRLPPPQQSPFSTLTNPIYLRRRANEPLSLDTPTSSTRWKPADAKALTKSPRTPVEPPYSPISDVESPPSISDLHRAMVLERQERQLELEQARRHSAGNQARTARGSETDVPATTRSTGIRTRSQSASTQIQHSPVTVETTEGSKIKQEQPPTPAQVTGNDTDSKVNTAPGTKRQSKENHRPSLQATTAAGSGSAPNLRLILTTRNFPRTTAPLLNDIGGHKFASLFAAPVKEKDAPGYKDLIYSPQDLKSIKTAIANGQKAVTAVTGAASSSNISESPFIAASPGDLPTPSGETTAAPTPSAPTAPSSTSKNAPLWIPANPDVVPPKGIVNSAQLEKELMRMFANAVMFNSDPGRGFGPSFRRKRHRQHATHSSGNDSGAEPPDSADEDDDDDDDDGSVVTDTREMFEAVERSVADWRAAERTTAFVTSSTTTMAPEAVVGAGAAPERVMVVGGGGGPQGGETECQ